jgi:small subunit ribosomal protein S17e
VDRIKRLALDLLKNHKERFGTDFAENKKVLEQVSIIRSKCLKNELAGYITKCIKRELEDIESEKQELNQTVDEKQSFEAIEAKPISEISS